MSCTARKYTATIKDRDAHVYYFGLHTCQAKIVTERQTDFVAEALAVDPLVKPSRIQSNDVNSGIRLKRQSPK